MSYGFNNAYQGLIKDTSVIGFITVALVLTAGTALLLWLGDQISQYGVGNGVSIIILAGIIARLPMEFIQVYESQIKDAENLTLAILKIVIVAIIVIGIVAAVVYMQEAIRKYLFNTLKQELGAEC